MPYRIETVVPRFYRSQTRSATAAVSAWHKTYSPDRTLYNRNLAAAYENEKAQLGYGSKVTLHCEPIDPELLPKTLFLRIEEKPYLDFYRPDYPMDTWVVSRKCMELIEKFDPDRHQFIPVKLRTPNNTLVRKRYFFFINMNHTFSLDLDRSPDVMLCPRRPRDSAVVTFHPKIITKNPHMTKLSFDRAANLQKAPGLVLKSKDAVGLEIWRELAIQQPNLRFSDNHALFVSDALFEEIMKQKLNGICAGNRAIFDVDLGNKNLPQRNWRDKDAAAEARGLSYSEFAESCSPSD